MSEAIYINGVWVEGNGEVVVSLNPATQESVWQKKSADASQVSKAVNAARKAFAAWSLTSLEERLAIIAGFKSLLEEKRDVLAELIAQETGKILWDAKGEAAAAIGKMDISLAAYHERTGDKRVEGGLGMQALRHRPHGVMAVFGPYNFPAHLPNGHIVPALIAGNTVVFKPSEYTPAVGEYMVKLWEEAGVPEGVINLVQGAREVGEALVANDHVDGILFTGSAATGKAIHTALAGKPEKLLALELGGNNPLIAWDASDIKATAFTIIQSAFITSGQRCTCARRLILPKNDWAKQLLDEVCAMASILKVGAYTDTPEPYMGPLIGNREADAVEAFYNALVRKGGAALLALTRKDPLLPFVTPGIVDVSGISVEDAECFGPVLQVDYADNLDDAIHKANNTRYGLSAGILTEDDASYAYFLSRIRAGIVNWNQQLTGASGANPFGGIGISGNHRPSAYYAADYAAYPVASIEKEKIAFPANLPPGINI